MVGYSAIKPKWDQIKVKHLVWNPWKKHELQYVGQWNNIKLDVVNACEVSLISTQQTGYHAALPLSFHDCEFYTILGQRCSE